MTVLPSCHRHRVRAAQEKERREMIMSKPMCDPPLLDQYGELFHGSSCRNSHRATLQRGERGLDGECQPPVIDLRGLIGSGDVRERQACVSAIAEASTEWGFFQVVNHGISRELLGEMRRQQRRVFELPFERKATCCRLLGDSYRWGTPTANSASQFSWSEAFHVPLTKIYEESEGPCNGEFSELREVTERFAGAITELAVMIAAALEENLGQPAGFLAESCSKSTCFLRLNRYPPCPLSPMFGLVPHTDSDFLTVLYQDDVGGLQLMKDSKWVAVRPNPHALIINIGDLFQAWSNDVYKSVEHRVLANGKAERFSIAYFMCPSYDSTIGAYREPSAYRSFTFGEYRRQVQEDVKKTGGKVGLPKFVRL